MNIHPIVVHFPIALLTLYAVFELVRFKRVLEKPYWFYVKAILSIFGALGALVAFMTGPEVHDSPLVDMHARFATTTLIIFGVIALDYLNTWLRRENKRHISFALPHWLDVPLALLGLIVITITGGLGGAVVYGTQFDPLMAPIFKLLGVY